jgi:hypothetical protein
VRAPRIALVHALRASIAASEAAFARGWPEAQTSSLLDESLSRDLAARGGLDEDLTERLLALGLSCVRDGADAVLFTCSAFGAAIDLVREAVQVPVLKPNEAMVEQAVRSGTSVALLATFAPTLGSMVPEFHAEAARQGHAVVVATTFVDGALAALEAGDPERHDELVAEAASRQRAPGPIALAQFSMARAAERVVAATGRQVLTTPDAAVAKLRRTLGA